MMIPPNIDSSNLYILAGSLHGRKKRFQENPKRSTILWKKTGGSQLF